MNGAMDLYEFEDPAAGRTSSQSNTPTGNGTTLAAATTDAAQPTLNEEVQQALTSFGRFWGGFRQQSVAALASARRDFGSVVEQAQKEIGKLSANATSPQSTPRPSTDATTDAAEGATETAKETTSDKSNADPKSSPTAPDSEEQPGEVEQTQRNRSGSLFSFIQSSLPPTIAQNLSAAPATLQSTFQRTLANPEVQNIRAGIASIQESVQSNQTVRNLQTSVQNFDMQSSVQSLQSNVVKFGSTVQSTVQSNLPKNAEQAKEGIMHVGEEFWKGAGEFFREAVKIVPPPDVDGGRAGAVWDGTDIWLFEDLGGDVTATDAVSDGKGKGKVTVGGEGIAVNRTAALLKKLREDPELVRVNPENGESKQTYLWFLDELEGKGGAVGSDAWTKKCNSEEEMSEDLKKMKATLVPEEIDETTFWKRYWFRAWQIKQAEEKRKALLEATAKVEKEEEFSWEDEEDTDTTPAKTETQTPLEGSVSTLTQPKASKVSEKISEAKSIGDASSPRESDDSYDMVGRRSGNASGTALAAAPSKQTVKEKGKEEREVQKKRNEDDDEDDEEEDDEDEDEDEEGEDEDEDEDEDQEGEKAGEEEEDSDWE